MCAFFDGVFLAHTESAAESAAPCAFLATESAAPYALSLTDPLHKLHDALLDDRRIL